MAVKCYSALSRCALLGISLGVLTELSSTATMAADQITFVSQGGAYQKAQTVAILDPSAKKLGITINQDSIPDAWPVMKSQVASGRPTWDVVDVPTGYCLRGGEQDLVEKLDLSKIPNAAAMPEQFRSPYSVAYEFYSSVLAYSQKKYPDGAAPSSWADFWDVKKFPGTRSLSRGASETMEIALMADGVAPDRLYPIDVERAINSLEKIKPHVVAWWSSGAQAAQLLKDGEADMVAIWNGRASAVIKDGAKAATTYNQGILNADCLVIPKGAKNAALAQKIIALMVSPELQADIPGYIDYGPITAKAFEVGKISPEMAERVNSSPRNAARQTMMNFNFWRENLAKLTERMDAFLQR
jgi:putative spermidine/putrescine transport system substrate-binding protein